jgi:hypothetical protein
MMNDIIICLIIRRQKSATSVFGANAGCFDDSVVVLGWPAQPAPFAEGSMSFHPSFSVLPLRRPMRGAVQTSSADPQFFTAVTQLLAVLIADAILILAAWPGLADLASLYVSTT